MSRKYELLEREEDGLCRIRALRDIPEIVVKAGDIGGRVQSEENLSQEGNCWVRKDAEACGEALVYEDAQVYGDARVFGRARVFGCARVYGFAWVFRNACVFGDARVLGGARVFGNCFVYENARVDGNAQVYGDARVYGTCRLRGDSWIGREAQVENEDDFLCISELGNQYGPTTFYHTTSGISVLCDYFSGTLEEFRQEVRESHGNGKCAREYELACQLAELHILEKEKQA